MWEMIDLIFDVLESKACCYFALFVTIVFNLVVWLKQRQWEYAPKEFRILDVAGEQRRGEFGPVWVTEVKYMHPLSNGNIGHHWDVTIIPGCTECIRHPGGVYTAVFYGISPEGLVKVMNALYAYNRSGKKDLDAYRVLLDLEEGRIR